jgi:hypothetical protein
MADAVTKLMTLEKALAEMITNATTDEDERRYNERIFIVRKEIDKLLGIAHEELLDGTMVCDECHLTFLCERH